MFHINKVFKAIERFCEAPKDEYPKVTKINVKQQGTGNRTYHVIVRKVSLDEA